MARTALLAGGTGLVGSACLDRLLASPGCGAVIAPARRPLRRSDPRLRPVEVGRISDPALYAGVGGAICCLGTTLRAAGSREAFAAVDLGLVRAMAVAAARAGVPLFVLVSALGADPGSRIFYHRVKGRAEEAVRAQGFESLQILRPSLLLGPRRERRPAESAGKALAMALRPWMVGALRRYRPVSAGRVAALACELFERAPPGTQVHYPAD